jgi:hypothetical protein
MSRTLTSLVIELMSKVPARICSDTLFHSWGPRNFAIGPNTNGVLDAWETCSFPWERRASQIASASM